MAARHIKTEAEGLLEDAAPPPRLWKSRRLLAVGAPSLAVALVVAAALATGRLPWTAGLDLEEVDGPPPLPELDVQAKFRVPSGSAEDHIQRPSATDMMSEAEEEGCSHDDDDCEEGDELLDPDQKHRRLEERNATMFGPHARSLATYNPYNGKIKLWPGGVVKYSWDSAIDSRAKSALVAAMREWEAKTCVRFKESPAGKGVVLYKSSGSGCNAHVGWSSHWPHTLNLSPRGCTGVGTAIHELGHTIGLRHEHARPEATEFIRFSLGNADPWWKQWLKTYENMGDMSANLPYDMGSIMHYGAWAGARRHDGKDSTKTISVKKPDVFGNCQVGQRMYLSEGDILTVNRWYGCPDHFCADLNKHCNGWKGRGFCKGRYESWMGRNCPHACGRCECKDKSSRCEGYAKAGYCHRGQTRTARNKAWMSQNCRRSCGNCLMEDASLCKDTTIWNDPESCSKYKSRKKDGKPWCKNSWFAQKCPSSCNLCPHHPFCW
mmetsp:Transcript_77606/g.240453  ORF Transcript_77606/g.240453 Transcript_77606/m.240453 type:complete len:492 (+) Transcript_77606:48-1523(+)